ncbi:MAG: NAD(P)/FAD-dependent oxidoreductase [Planctomycetota bacterium]
MIIIGAGPAGLGAAHELTARGVRPLVIEKAGKAGGIARTEIHNGHRFDIGGHRFYTKCDEVRRLWQETLGDDFIEVSRQSRIFYRGRFIKYPLELTDTIRCLGPVESFLILLSYLKTRALPPRGEETFEQWMTRRFGARLYRTFFKTYTEKIWGIPCNVLQADWAAQRIRGLSLTAAVRSAVFGSTGATSLIKEFRYPTLGPGMMWQRFEQAVRERGGQVRMNAEVGRLHHEAGRITNVVVREAGGEAEVPAEHVISSMPLTELAERLSPPAPGDVLRAAAGLKYRAFVMAALIVDRADLFSDNWIYVHDPSVKVGRIQNFKNWSAAMVADPAKTCVGMEYFCAEDDELWTTDDAALLDLAARELATLGLAERAEIEDGAVVRQPMAYPVYDAGYAARVAVVRDFAATLGNLQTVGRNGMYRYNNQDHSMLTGMLAARNLLGERHDLWRVNAERSHGEAVAPNARPAVTAPGGPPQ